LHDALPISHSSTRPRSPRPRSEPPPRAGPPRGGRRRPPLRPGPRRRPRRADPRLFDELTTSQVLTARRLLRETHHTAAQTSSAASCGGLPAAAHARAAQRPGALSATDRCAGRTARSAAYTTARVGLSRERRRRRPRPALAVVASAPGSSRTAASRRDRLLRGRAAALPSPVPKELLHGRPPPRRPVDRLRDHR